MTLVRKALATIATIGLITSIASPAEADKANFTDKRGDLKGGFDIRKVAVKNNGGWIKVRSVHRELRYGPSTPSGGVSFFLDINPGSADGHKGPDYMIGGPVGDDGDFAIGKVHRWKLTTGPLNCQVRFHVNYKTESVRAAVPRRCLIRFSDLPVHKIRVAVRASQSRAHGQPKNDWAPRRHKLYPAVPRA